MIHFGIVQQFGVDQFLVILPLFLIVEVQIGGEGAIGAEYVTILQMVNYAQQYLKIQFDCFTYFSIRCISCCNRTQILRKICSIA